MTKIPTIAMVDALASEYADKSPSEILALALDQEGEIAISFSGAEDVVLIYMASNLGKPFRVFSLDTGRLHAETYQFIEKVRQHYNIDIEICFPETEAIQQRLTLFPISLLSSTHSPTLHLTDVPHQRRRILLTMGPHESVQHARCQAVSCQKSVHPVLGRHLRAMLSTSIPHFFKC